jgi:hypothetical protein
MRTLFENERVITEAENRKVVLTNKRIWKEDVSGGKSFYQSMMLRHISSIQCTIEDYVTLLIIGVLLIGLAFLIPEVKDNDVERTGMIVCGVVFIVFYFVTRSKTIVIASSSMKIKLSAGKIKKDMVLQFIDQVEKAIDENASVS